MSGLFRALVHAFPRPFRRRFGAEMAEQAEEACARAFERGRVAGWIEVARTALDLVLAGMVERAAPTWTPDARTTDDDGRVGMMTRGWLEDIRRAVRSLGKSPGFAVGTVGTLALALGVNAGVFSVVHAVLLDPLPYGEPDRLVHIAATAPGTDLPEEFGVSVEFLLEYGERAEQLESVATHNSFTTTVRAEDRVERLRVSMPSLSLFETLDVAPHLGRLPATGEGGRVALISHGLWTTWFGRDPSVIGRAYDINGEAREVIGVMPEDFVFPVEGVVAWVPMEPGLQGVTTPGQFGMDLVGRLAPGADHASLQRELTAIARGLPELYGGSPAYARVMERHRAVVRPLEEEMLGPVSSALWVLMGAVGVVLLVACANVANLFVVRSQGRARDLAVRRAIGAGRTELVRFQMAEAVVVAGLAGVAALGLAWLALPAFVAVAPENVPRLSDARLSGATLVFTFLAAGLAALLCGLVPALRSSVPNLHRLRDGTRGSTTRHRWGRDALVLAQTAMTLVLLVGSGLLFRSFQELNRVDPGYDTEDILTFQFAPEEAHLVDGPSWARFHLDFMDRLRALPGVESVGIVENVPLDEGLRTVQVQTGEAPDATDGPRVGRTLAAGDYFEAMGLEVLQGRGFTEEDARVPGRMVVSRAAADAIWPGEDPVGKRLRSNSPEGWHTVVGVVEDVLQYDLRDEPTPIIYYPLVGPPPSWALTSPGYVVRTGRASTIAPEIRALVREVAPSAPMYRVYTMEELAARSLAQLTFTMLTLALAAALALVLGATGLYGVLSHLVAERSREIGVRMALGADASGVRRMVVAQGLRVVGLGVVVGLAVAWLARGLLASQLYGVEGADPLVFGGMASTLLAVGVLASYLPARRASAVDPIESMRAG